MHYHIQKFKKAPFVIFGILGICFLTFFTSFFLFFKVKKIIIISQESTLFGLNEIGEKNIFFLDFAKLTAYLLDQNPTIKSVHLEKKYPDTVIIKTEERITYAQIFVGDKKINIDYDGFIVAYHKENLNEYLRPIYMDRNPPVAGNSADVLVLKAIRYFDEFEKIDQNLEKVTVEDSSNSYILLTESQITLFIPFSEDPKIISSSLQLILTRFRIEGKRVTKVNFLFDKPIITLANE